MKDRGITLVALVVTIIVLIILAGVSINLLLGDNGLIARANGVTELSKKTDAEEKLKLMLSAYSIDRYASEKLLENYLNEKKAQGVIDEVTNNGDGTFTVELHGYEAVIRESDLVIIRIEVAKIKPTVSDIQITLDGTQGAEEGSLTPGTPIQINFTHSIEGGTTTVDKELPYTTDGSTDDVTFTITGTINGETSTKVITVSVASKYAVAQELSAVEVGDFINYKLGNWTTADIAKLGDLYVTGGSQPTSSEAFKFGGFTTSTSKDSTITTTDGGTAQYGGWRVLKKNDDGTIDIIHAGTPEGYYSPVGTNYGYKSQYILTGVKHSGDTTTITNGVTARDWSMYEDCSTDSVSTSYAVAGSARCLDYPFGVDKKCTLTYSNYWLPQTCGGSEATGLMYGGTTNDNGETVTLHVLGDTAGCMGVRPIVTIRVDAKVAASGANQTTHDTPETAWNLCM